MKKLELELLFVDPQSVCSEKMVTQCGHFKLRHSSHLPVSVSMYLTLELMWTFRMMIGTKIVIISKH